jgi:protein-tyrosine phosphatase
MVREHGLAGRIRADSAGTADYHPGKPPDWRSQRAARLRGYDLSSFRARQVRAADFHAFDYVLAMDRDNHADLLRVCPQGREPRVKLFLSFAQGLDLDEVPDPYHGGGDGFETVLDLVEAASLGLLQDIRARL